MSRKGSKKEVLRLPSPAATGSHWAYLTGVTVRRPAPHLSKECHNQLRFLEAAPMHLRLTLNIDYALSPRFSVLSRRPWEFLALSARLALLGHRWFLRETLNRKSLLCILPRGGIQGTVPSSQGVEASSHIGSISRTKLGTQGTRTPRCLRKSTNTGRASTSIGFENWCQRRVDSFTL